MFPLEKLAELATADLLGNLQHHALVELSAKLDRFSLPGGKTLFHAGEPGDAMYIVVAGRLRILSLKSNGQLEAIRELGRGESVGELALVTGMARSATVRAIRDSELARLSRAAFEEIRNKQPDLANELLRQIAVRQSQGRDRSLAKRNVRTLALVPFDAAAPVDDFARPLVETLQELGSAVHLTASSELAGGSPNRDRESQSVLTERLTELESRHRFVIYQADAEFSAWSEQCIRQADLVFLVAAADGAPATFRREQLSRYFSTRETAPEIELVLLHGAHFNPKVDTDRWLSGLPIRDYYHVVGGSKPDFQRLARFLTGTAIGVVLSGGGARGFAHIGILRALEECGIPVDFIGGTSMGAVVAAQYAAGWDWQTMSRENRRHWPRCHPQRNYTLPLVALNSGRRMDNMLKEMWGALAIENLPGKFFCVSTNLTRADEMVHRTGALWKAVRASVSIPGIGPPAVENGEILVDGGLMNNLPVDVMRRLCQGTVYAVDVSEQTEFRSSLQESYSVSGWQLLWRRLNPFAAAPDLPNIFNILYRATSVGSLRATETVKATADLYLCPPVESFGIFDWSCIERIIDVGYRYGLKALHESEDLQLSSFSNTDSAVRTATRGVDKSTPPLPR